MSTPAPAYRGSVWRMPNGRWTSYPLIVEGGEQIVQGGEVADWSTWEEALAYVLGFLGEPLPSWLIEGFDAHAVGVQARVHEDAERERRSTWLFGADLEAAIAMMPNLAEDFPDHPVGRFRRKWCRR